MKTSKLKIVGPVALSSGAFLLVVVMMILRAPAQPANSHTLQTNGMAPFIEAVQEATISGTEATNLTKDEWNHLMNESIKTNLAAQLWFRTAMVGQMSHDGAKIAEEIRVLKSLREGHTEDAVRMLENNLDGDIILLADKLRVSDTTKEFRPTPQPVEALKSAKEYRLQFPHKTDDPTMAARVKNDLSYLDQR